MAWDVHIDSTLVGNTARNTSILISSALARNTNRFLQMNLLIQLANLTSRFLDFMKLDSAIALLNINIRANITLIISSNITLIITVNIYVVYAGSGILRGDEIPLRSWCISVADMVCKNWDDFSSGLIRLKIFGSSATSSQLSFSNVCISVIHLDFCHSAAEVPCATNDCHDDSNDNNDDDMKLCISIYLCRCSVFFTVRHNFM